MEKSRIVFPHQLFQDIRSFDIETPIYLVEETLFFNQYNFHKQKLSFHRASMKFYENYLVNSGYSVHYIEAIQAESDIRNLISSLVKKGVEQLYVIDPTDYWLEKRILKFKDQLSIVFYDNPLFLNTREDLATFFNPAKKKFFQTSFYKAQRRKRNILMDHDQPLGGKWTFDVENRKKYPKSKIPPKILFPKRNDYTDEARNYVLSNFSEHIGELDEQSLYPTDYKQAEEWLQAFFQTRFYEFGDYEDAIVQEKHFLHHSVLSPLINVGLLTPKHVVSCAINYAKRHSIPINSLEGFIRQIMGWREFIRGIYEAKGVSERTTNFWNHNRKIPNSFYEGSTGILPIDDTIRKILKTGYAHHIERLMILGNFMLLCEFDPDEVYQWFMELFIDAYDWVMVPNVYGMSLFADGGLFATKPYISSSNYIKKMSDYPSGEWQQVWDGLFWRFMDKNSDFLSKNPRLKMLINTLDKMENKKRDQHFLKAETFLEGLSRPKNNIQLKITLGG